MGESSRCGGGLVDLILSAVGDLRCFRHHLVIWRTSYISRSYSTGTTKYLSSFQSVLLTRINIGVYGGDHHPS